jgi:hypothetical protein
MIIRVSKAVMTESLEVVMSYTVEVEVDFKSRGFWWIFLR